ncbi:MAG: fibronectin type III domain-containing protein [Prevotellaceae bacterium]|jgi:hypothetical protein|nr:fibronectin type III domain-containing protein [Prevotellaceae bacterium]
MMKQVLQKMVLITSILFLCGAFVAAQTTTTVRVSYGNADATTTLNYTFPALPGTQNITAEAWGGGGGGGGARCRWSGEAAGGGGGGGAYAAVNFGSVNETFSIRVGYGGALGSGNQGGSSGDYSQVSYLSNYIKANGGGGGGAAQNETIGGRTDGSAGAAGTAEAVGTYTFTKENGIAGNGGNCGSANTHASGGNGGNAAHGGGTGGSGNQDNNGNAGNYHGGGGAGGGYYQAGASWATRNGGKGANGKVQITFSYLTPATPVISSSLADNLAFENTVTLTVENYDSRFSYQWYKDNQKLDGFIDNTYTVSTPGAYEVRVSGDVTASSFNFPDATTVEVTANGDNSVISGTTLNIGTAKETKRSRTVTFVLKYDKSGIADFGEVAAGASADPKQYVDLTLYALAGTVNVSLENGASSAFSITENQFTDDGQIEILFTPNVIGAINDVLIISAPNAAPVRIPLSGTGALPKPVALTASDTTSSRFIANWEEVALVEYYLLTVKDGTDAAVEGYDDLNVGNVLTYEVSNLMPESNYTYTVKAVSNGYTSVLSNEISVTTLEGAVITYSNMAEFVQEVNISASKTIRVSGTHLAENIALDLQGTYFSIDKSEIDATGGSAKITYAPTQVGKHTATLTLTSNSAETRVITLKGTALPAATTALPATEVGNTSFVANWNTVAGAVDYLLTVTSGSETILNEQSTAGASTFAVNAEAGKNYTYSVKVVEAGLASAASNEITVITCSAPQPEAYPEKKSVRVLWAAVPQADGYKVTLKQGSNVVGSYNNVSVSETEFNFTGLSFNTDYTYEVVAVFGASEYSSGFLAVKTTTEFYGQQIPNLGFELWDNGNDYPEPVSWNSFGNVAGSLDNMAKANQVDASSTVRPGTTGTKSAKINSRDAFMGIIANGNLTTGQIQANSATASSSDNHNKTIPSNPSYSTPLGGKPDSLTVWVKSNTTREARVSAIIHDNYEYRDPESGSDGSHVVAKAVRNYGSAGNTWQRLSVPFSYVNNSLSPDYILISFSTDKEAGKGTTSDEVYIDDMQFIYKPSLAIGTPNKAKYLPSERLTISYTLTGTMSASNLNAAANTVTLQLSDASGSFANPRQLAQITGDNSGVFSVTLPSDLPLSANYKLRVVTTNYPMTSDASAAFELRSAPAVPVALDATELSAASFVANWEEVEGTTGYVLNVNGTETILAAGVTSYLVKNLQPETPYTYKVKALKNDLSSDYSNTIPVSTLSGGVIYYDGYTALTTIVNGTKASTLTVSGAGLLEGVSVNFTGNPSGFFALSTNNVEIEGGDIEITYSPTAIGTHTARLLLKSLFADNVFVELSGTSLPPATEAAAADSLTPVSFKAHWAVSADAEAYVLTVTDNEGTPIEGYNELLVNDTSLVINGLSSATDYSYSVKVKAQNLLSAASNEIEATTLSKPQINTPAIDDFEQLFTISDEQTITISGSNLLGKISVELSGSAYFSIDKSEVESGETITLTYAPAAPGTHAARLKLSSDYAETVEININGIAKDTATSLPLVTSKTVVAYPNPTSDLLYLNGIENKESYRITDSKGSTVQTGVLTNSQISVQTLPNGLYWLQIGQTNTAFVKK